MRRLLTVLFCLLLLAPAFAQAPANYTYVYGTKVEDAGGNALASGTITFTPTNAQGVALAFRPGGGGTAILRPVQAQVVNGAFSVNLADVSLASPSYFCYAVTAEDNTTGATVLGGSGYSCLQPTGATFDLDNYTASTVPVLPAGGYSVTGNFGVNGNLNVTGALTTGSYAAGILSATYTNGIVNAAEFAGADIGAQVNAAFAACQSEQGSDQGCTVFVPNGAYSYSTGIVIPAGPSSNNLVLDYSANLTYTGSGVAVYATGGYTTDAQGVRIMGGKLIGTSAATAGIQVDGPLQNVVIDNVGIYGFSAADGILGTGPDAVSIFRSQIQGNLNGIHIIGQGGYAGNAWHIAHNIIQSNLHWGVLDGDLSQYTDGSTSPNLGNVIESNVFGNNGTASAANCNMLTMASTCFGGIAEGLTTGTSIKGNYFEEPHANIYLGMPSFAIPSHLQTIYRAPTSNANGGTAFGTDVEGNEYESHAFDFITMYAAGNAIVVGNVMDGSVGTGVAPGTWTDGLTVCAVDNIIGSMGLYVSGNGGSGPSLCQGGYAGWPAYSINQAAQDLTSPAGAVRVVATGTQTDDLFQVIPAGATQPAFHVDSNGYVWGGMFKTGVSGNDAAGQITLSGGAASYTFVNGSLYTLSPICTATDTSALLPVRIVVTTAGFTLTGTGSDVINYLCTERY